MSENTLKLSKSIYSITSGLTIHASESQQSSGSNGLRTKKSYREDYKLSKEGIKSYSLSLPTDKENEITKNQTKKEIKPIKSILKNSASTRTSTRSSRTSARREIGTLKKVTTSTRGRTSSLKSPVEIARPKRKQPNELSESKSLLSVISKVSSRSQRSLFRDVAFRNYPISSSFTSTGSALSLFSSKTQMSTISQGLREKSQKKVNGPWGFQRVSILKAQPKESDPRLVKSQTMEAASVQAQSRKSLKASDPICSSDSEDQAMVEAESPDRELEEPLTDEPAERSVFLQTFRNLPDIDDLSSTTTLETVEPPEEETDFQYVPPVDQDSSYESDISLTPISSLEEVESFTAVQVNSLLSTDISLDLLSESEDEPLKLPSFVEPHLEDISVLMNIVEQNKVDVVFESSSSIANDKLGSPLIDKIEEFLDDLLQQAANLAYENRMRRILDKEKLVDELKGLSVQYKAALEENQCLDQVISEYFMRRKEFAFVVRDGDHSRIHIPRLMEAIKSLDFNLKREEETKLVIDDLLEKLRAREKIAKGLEVQKVEHFEAEVRKSILKDGFKRLNSVINNLFREMNAVRNEVSKSRLKVASVKHQLATMQIKSKQVEDQGAGVTEYLANQAVTQTLGVKIWERNAELSRLKDRVTHDLHIISHLKEKEKLKQGLLQEMRDKLMTKRLRHKQLRDLFHTEMARRKRLKKETENARRGCLIPYPKLLRDYDATEDHLWAKQKVIQKLRSELNRMEGRLSHVEDNMAAFIQTAHGEA